MQASFLLIPTLQEKTRVDMHDWLHQDSLEEQGSVLILRQQDTEQRTLDKLKILLEVSKQPGLIQRLLPYAITPTKQT